MLKSIFKIKDVLCVIQNKTLKEQISRLTMLSLQLFNLLNQIEEMDGRQELLVIPNCSSFS